MVVTGVPKQWELRPGETLSIGRAEGREIRLDHNSVSRKHASLGWDAQGTWIRDEGSTNGVFVDDVQISARTPLRVGQVAEIGQFQLRLEEVGALLPDDSGELTLFDSEEPLESGMIHSARDVEEILLHTGDLERTGTLVFRLGKTTAEILVYEGQIVSAQVGKLTGDAALKLLSEADRQGTWHFYARVKLVEDAVQISTRRFVDTMRLKRMKRPK